MNNLEGRKCPFCEEVMIEGLATATNKQVVVDVACPIAGCGFEGEAFYKAEFEYLKNSNGDRILKAEEK